MCPNIFADDTKETKSCVLATSSWQNLVALRCCDQKKKKIEPSANFMF